MVHVKKLNLKIPLQNNFYKFPFNNRLINYPCSRHVQILLEHENRICVSSLIINRAKQKWGSLANNSALASHSNLTALPSRTFSCPGRIFVNSGRSTVSLTLTEFVIVTDSPHP